MGCCMSNESHSNSKENHTPVRLTNPIKYPEPEQSGESEEYFPRLDSPAQGPKGIERCSALLREMYTLDLMIWGMESAVRGEEVRKREDNKRKADALFVEIRRMVYGWSADGFRWQPQERAQIKEICQLLDQHRAERYN